MGRKKKSKPSVDRTSGDQKIAVIWTRVSTKEQADNNLSLDTQLKACEDYALRYGIEVDKVMGQTNESAKEEGKLYNEMITYVSMHRRVNMILVYSYDRFSRAGAEAIVTKAYLKSKGITVVSVTQPIDTDSMAGEFMENMLFLFNQFENNLRKQKCTAGMIECLENGDWFSRPPVGYVPDKSAGKHCLVIDEKGELIRKAFLWRAEGIEETEISRKLSLLGLKMDKQRLSQIFHNPFYCGKIKHHLLGDKIVKGNQPAIIDEQTWNRVNGIESHCGYEHQEETPNVPLKLHLVCSACGKHMTGYEVKKKGLWYYKCNTPGCKCNKSAKVMHSKYEDLLGGYELPEVVQTIVTETVKKILLENNVRVADDLSEIRRRRSSLVLQRDKAVMRFGIGEIPQEVYSMTRSRLDKDIDELDAEIQRLKKNSSNQVSEVNNIILTACNLRTLWQNGNYQNRQEIQKLAFPDGVIWDRDLENYRTTNENEALRLIRSISSNYKNEKLQKKEKSLDFSDLVAGGGLEPPTSGL